MNIKFLRKLMNPGNVIQALIWNMGGICFYSFCRWLINIAAVRMAVDFADAGILTLAVSITGIWNVIAMFSIRNIQVSDIKSEHTDSEYVSARVVTVFAAIILCVIHAAIFTGDVYKTLVISAYMLLVASTAFVDVMHGIMQKQWRMDIIGISHVIRGFALLVPFVLLFHFFNLLTAVVGMAISSVVIVFIFDTRFARKYADFRIAFDLRRLLPLFRICIPLVIVSFLSSLIPSTTRMVLERLTNTETLGIYGSVTLPASIVQTVVASTFAPFVNVFTRHLRERNYKGYLRAFWTGAAGVVVFFAVFFALTFPFGDWLINLLFGAGMEEYTYLFREAAIFCFFSCFCWFAGIPLVICRYVKTIMVIYAAGVVVCGVLLRTMLERFGMSGANYVQIAASGTIALALLTAALIISRKEFINELPTE